MLSRRVVAVACAAAVGAAALSGCSQNKGENEARETGAAVVTEESNVKPATTPAVPDARAGAVAVVKTGVPGGIVVQTQTMTARVTAVDASNRTVTLLGRDGRSATVVCGSEVVNFPQIKVGDQLKVTIAEQLAVYMATDAPRSDDSATSVVALAPEGAKPGGIAAKTVQITATVTGIDLEQHRATLKFPDGSTRTVAVRKDVDLTQRKIGEEVVIRATEALAISVEKP